MTWLSKIEKKLKGYSDYRTHWGVNKERTRMASGIRELAGVVMIIDDTPLTVQEELVWQTQLYDALDKLSPDAKEVIEECGS